MLKWCLNRPHQTKTAADLNALTGMQCNDEIYKPLRKSEIEKEEKKICNLINVLQDEYLNPFSPRLEQDVLFNLSSGVPAQGNVEDLLNIRAKGKELADEFIEKRLVSKEKSFNDPIPRVKVPNFHQTQVKIPKANKQLKVVEANRNIIGRLLSLSTKSSQPINLEAALTYLLFPVPLQIQMGQKDQLKRANSSELEDSVKQISSYVLDMIAQLRMCLVGVSGTFEFR